MEREPWFVAPVTARLRQEAREMEREARRLRALASKIESPPEGVTVEYDGANTVRFVGPFVFASSHSESK